jgi:deoxyadenosine/deoxycytidine kinase
MVPFKQTKTLKQPKYVSLFYKKAQKYAFRRQILNYFPTTRLVGLKPDYKQINAG